MAGWKSATAGLKVARSLPLRDIGALLEASAKEKVPEAKAAMFGSLLATDACKRVLAKDACKRLLSISCTGCDSEVVFPNEFMFGADRELVLEGSSLLALYLDL